jgi:ubiquinone/menaquinone biosynthesis C-methylase UbiE
MKRQFYDLLADVYEERYSNTLNKKMRKEEKKLLLRYLKRGNVLDVGCGQGYHTKFLRENGFDVYGLDISKNMILTGGISLSVVADAAALPVKSDLFDNVISIFGALNHTDIHRFSQELERVLKPEGRLIVTVANARSFNRIMRRRTTKRGRVTVRKNGKIYSTRLRYYTPQEIRECFDQFKIKKIGGLYPRPIFLPCARNYGYYIVLYGEKA